MVKGRSNASAVATARAEIARLRDGLDRVESVLAGLDSASAEGGPRSRPERYYEMLIDVYEWGRHGADGSTLAELGRARGYDVRGLGGFFVGSRAPLRRHRGQVTLTLEGHRLLDHYLTGATR